MHALFHNYAIQPQIKIINIDIYNYSHINILQYTVTESYTAKMLQIKMYWKVQDVKIMNKTLYLNP